MGKKIDRIAGLILGTFCSYAYYMAMLKHPWIALALTGLTMLALRRITKTLCRMKEKFGRQSARARRQSARRRVEGWITAEEHEAAGDIAHLLARAYPEEIAAVNASPVYRKTGKRIPMLFLPRRTPLCEDDILSAWKMHRGREHVLLISTAPSGNLPRKAHLSHPRVITIDGDMLEKLAARHLETIAPAPQPAPRQKRMLPPLSRFTDRKKAPRYLMYGALMFICYLLIGQHAYLAAAITMLFLAGAGFHRAAAPERLL